MMSPSLQGAEILAASDFVFTPFVSDAGGDSGDLFLAASLKIISEGGECE
jgi:hypothetical protein